MTLFKSKRSRRHRSRKSEKGFSFSSARSRFIALCLFIGMIFLLGGSSRDDMWQLILLRPLTILFAGYALLLWQRSDFERIRPIFWMAAAMMALMLAQLIPLWPDLWQSLPGRELVANADALLGLSDQWRPISLSPSRTINSLWAMSVAMTALLLLAVQNPEHVKKILPILLIAGLASIVFGLLQIGSGANSFLYAYRISNNDLMIGFFANRNHQAVFLASIIIFSAWYLTDHDGSAQKKKDNFKLGTKWGAILLSLLILPFILNLGSRSGLLVAGAALLLAIPLASKGIGQLSGEEKLAQKANNINSRDREKLSRLTKMRRYSLAGFFAAILLVGIVFITGGRDLAIERFDGLNLDEELRAQSFPIIIDMIGYYFPWGTGFGSFEYVWRIHEPDQLLSPNYLNLAHNDYLQIMLEGGVAVLLILIAMAFWLVKVLFSLWRKRSRSQGQWWAGYAASCALLLYLMGSASDYPIRTPIITMVVAILLFLIHHHHQISLARAGRSR